MFREKQGREKDATPGKTTRPLEPFWLKSGRPEGHLWDPWKSEMVPEIDFWSIGRLLGAKNALQEGFRTKHEKSTKNRLKNDGV